MENTQFWKAINYAKYGEAVVDDIFQLDTGYPYNDRFNGINLSSLFSFLIREAGRLCDHYASDMFYDLKMIHEQLYGKDSILFDIDTWRTVIGIRDCGCDSEGMMLSRSDSEDTFTYRYREIVVIEITVEDGRGHITAHRASPSSVDHYFKKERMFV